jgi:hypothetical protein|tara:strand:+ start:259 stop:993 length:735 start_codon:yes stop_codon:yes gene_type:complete
MKTLNEEMKKMKRLFDYKKGEVITESEDKECDCGNEPCTCVEEGHYIGEDSEGEETFNYGEDEGEDHKEEEHLEGEEDMAPHDRIKEIKKHLEALEDDMSYDEEHEDRDEEGTDFSESKKYSKVLKTLSESQVKTLKRFVKIPLNEESLTYVEKMDNIMKSLERVVNSEVGESHEELRSVLDHSEVSKSMDNAKHCLMKSIESLREKFKKKKEKDSEKNESKKYSKVLNTLNESQVRKLKRFIK